MGSRSSRYCARFVGRINRQIIIIVVVVVVGGGGY
jgi:hypothetical protein